MAKRKHPEFVGVQVRGGIIGKSLYPGRVGTMKFFVEMMFDDGSLFWISDHLSHDAALDDAYWASEGRPVIDKTGRAH